MGTSFSPGLSAPGVGGELEARILTRATVLTGVLLLTAGGATVVLVTGMVAAMTSGALIGLGVGIAQIIALHTAMRRMAAGAHRWCGTWPSTAGCVPTARGGRDDGDDQCTP